MKAYLVVNALKCANYELNLKQGTRYYEHWTKVSDVLYRATEIIN